MKYLIYLEKKFFTDSTLLPTSIPYGHGHIKDMHIEKSTSDSCWINRNQIVFTIFQLIWNQTKFRLVPNQSENGNYNQIWVDLTRFRKEFSMCITDTLSTLLLSVAPSIPIEKIGLVPSPFCPSCGGERHTTIHVFSYFSHPTPLTEMDLLERPRLASEFLFYLLFFDLPPLLSPPPEPLPSGGQESQGQSSSSSKLYFFFCVHMQFSIALNNLVVWNILKTLESWWIEWY